MGKLKARTNWELSRNYEKLGMAVERGPVAHKQEGGREKAVLGRASGAHKSLGFWNSN